MWCWRLQIPVFFFFTDHFQRAAFFWEHLGHIFLVRFPRYFLRYFLRFACAISVLRFSYCDFRILFRTDFRPASSAATRWYCLLGKSNAE